MTDEERKLIEKGVRDYASLNISEKEMFHRLRSDYMANIYGQMPLDVKTNLNSYIDSLSVGSTDFYKGYLSAMEWYRGLVRGMLPVEGVQMFDNFHLPMYATIVHRMSKEVDTKRDYLESLFKKGNDKES